MQSVALLERHKADRPSFEVFRRGALSSPQAFRVFALPAGLLFLELRQKPGSGSNGPGKGAVAGAVLGGAVGAVIGCMIDNSMAEGPEVESGFDMMDEEQLIELAQTRKRSFVAKYEEIRSLALDAPGGFRRMLADRTLVGWMSLCDDVLGKMKLEFRDPMAMAVAVETLPRRLGDRVHVNVELDEESARFVKARR
jgi:hypothetical protein